MFSENYEKRYHNQSCEIEHKTYWRQGRFGTETSPLARHMHKPYVVPEIFTIYTIQHTLGLGQTRLGTDPQPVILWGLSG